MNQHLLVKMHQLGVALDGYDAVSYFMQSEASSTTSSTCSGMTVGACVGRATPVNAFWMPTDTGTLTSPVKITTGYNGVNCLICVF
jgi:hypothetical protein